MRKELSKTYDPSSVEDRIYKTWEEKGYFHAEPDSKKEPYTIVIPPPNVTGQLHMGHALDETLQDILIRYKRMKGFSALWLPGTDHAGIATQIKVEEALRVNEGLTRYDLGRDEFIKRVWDWKEKFGDRIIHQLKKLGSSCDWERERFTMDEGCSKAVKEVFVNLYEKGLIYKGNRIINWCPHCITALSDAEVEYTEQQGHFWHIKYPVKDSDEFVIIATTRPETLLGDTAVAVHPEDERYQHLLGKMLVLPLVGREIPVIADEYVEKDFGTGCVKITPAHDPNDFEVGQRHNLEVIKVMNDDATINHYGGKYEGMDRYEARKAVLEDLKAGGYLCEIEDLSHEVGTCYRCGTTIEPMISLQWFVKMEPLAKPAVEAVRDGRIKFVPERFDKNYFHWMENTQDWCISRQLWWGHRIPAFYCDDCGETVVSKDDCTVCPKCGGHMTQDPDTLDTWFSSALWPFSTMGWPHETEDLKKFYPTNTLVTGYDIITFWVSRMIFSALEYTDTIPFDTVLIHGLVRDAQGRKMSKSLGNGIDPLDIISQYGADALRFALLTGNSPGNDMRFSPEKIEAARNFTNKIWNASRFALMNIPETLEDTTLPKEEDMRIEDKWILSKLNTLVKEVTENIEKYELGVALAKLYDFIWNNFCDWYIEVLKPRFADDCENACRVLSYVLRTSMELLHPYMPFITETIWQALPHDGESIVITDYPEYTEAFNFPAEERSMERLISAIRAIRNRRAEMNVAPSKKAKLFIVTNDNATFNPAVTPFFQKLASASEVEYLADFHDERAVQIVADHAVIYIPLAEMIDFDAEIARLNKERAKMVSEIERIDKKLSNEGFVAKAPAAVIEGERKKREGYADKLKTIDESIAKYRS